MATPYFSLIVPTLNEAKYISKLLTDLSHQTYADFELIVVDGHSDDRTLEVCRQYAAKLKPQIIDSQVRHVCTQRNLGARHARGQVLLFIDADMRLPTYFLQGIKYRLESEPADVATSYAAPDRTYRQSVPITQALNLGLELAKNSQFPLINEGMTIISKTAFERLGGFDDTVDFAEGRKLLSQAVKLGLRYSVYKDPTYEYSVRRIRKYGLLRVSSAMARYALSELFSIPLSNAKISQLYPMLGGTVVAPYENRRRFRTRLESFFYELKKPSRLKSRLDRWLLQGGSQVKKKS